MNPASKNRCILIFPQIENIGIIDEIRERYDPLAERVRPHITLVFPFVSEIRASDLKIHLAQALCGIKPFEVTLSGITGDILFERFLFLNIDHGKSEIIEMHKRLYTGILEEFMPVWLKNGAFFPHMTVGKIDDREQFEIAVEETKDRTESFKTIINKVSVEIIEENGDSSIEMEADLI